VPTKSIVDGKLELGAQTWLLGLMHGHFDVKDLNVDVIKEEGLSAINSGIGVVVPVERISETLAHPDVARHRREAAERTPKRDDPCPCGSGRKYIECHGAEIRSVTRLTLEELGLTADEFKAMLEAEKHRRGGNNGTD
jgi:SEC-C motif